MLRFAWGRRRQTSAEGFRLTTRGAFYAGRLPADMETIQFRQARTVWTCRRRSEGRAPSGAAKASRPGAG